MNSVEPIRRLQEVEQRAQQEIENARQRAQKILADAESASKEIEKEITKEFQQKAVASCQRIQQETDKQLSEIRKYTRTEENKLQTLAKNHFSRAVSLIIETLLE